MDDLLPPQLPGLRARRPLGQGIDPPWLARAEDGAWVVVRCRRRPPQLPEHPGLLRVNGTVTDLEGRSWVLTPYVTGNGLDRRLERVGQVGADATAAWGAVLADALAALHDAGLVHGDLGAARVLLGASDTVLLDATCARWGAGQDREQDVRALAAVLDVAAGTPEVGPLAAVLAQVAAGGIGAAELCRRLRAMAGPRATRGHSAGRSRAVRGAVAVATAAVLLAGAGVVGVRLAGDPAPVGVLAGAEKTGVPAHPSPTPARPATVGPTLPAAPRPPRSERVGTDWVAVIGTLDAARGRAFASADPRLLSGVDLPGSEAHVRDRALVDALRATGVTARGWATRVVSAVPTSVAPDHVVLSVVDTMAPYVLRDASGALVAQRPARGPTAWTVRLATTGGGWRVTSVSQVEDSED